MNLNTITFSAEFNDEGGLSVDFLIDEKINCESFYGYMGFSVDPMILFSSFHSGISDYLFTCGGCGEPGCSYIISECGIIYNDDFVVWFIPNPVSVSHEETRPVDCKFDKFCFDINDYRIELQKLAVITLQITDFTFSDKNPNDFFINDYNNLKTKLERIASADLERMQ